MIDTFALSGEPSILDLGAPPPLDAACAARVDELWAEQKQLRGDALFDDDLFSLASREGATLRGAFVPYRRFVAQRLDPSLDAALRVRPLGVMALPWVEGGLLFALRSTAMEVDPGCWELPPSGGLDRGALRPDGTLDARWQLLDELREELDAGPADVTACTPLALVRDSVSHITEVAFRLELGVSFDELRARSEASANREYTELRLVAPRELESFRAEHGAALTGVAAALLRHAGL